MSWCKRSQLSMATFRNVSLMGSKYLARNSVGSSPISGKMSLISSRFVHLGGGFSQSLNNVLPIRAGKRSYESPNFNPKGSKKWFEKPRNILLGYLFGSGMAIYLCNLEPIPYTDRTHFVLMSIETEKVLGENLFNQHKQRQSEGKIFPANHPVSVRMNSIAKNMVEALQRLILQGDPDFGSYDEFKMETERKGKAQPDTEILERFDWEVVILDTPSSTMACVFPGGKLMVSSGILRHFESDAEAAAYIGHAFGHIVARHLAKLVAKEMCKAILRRILCYFVTPDVVNSMAILKMQPFSTEMEAYANYVALMLMASAGYDPSAIISMSKKVANLNPNPESQLCYTRGGFDPKAHAMKKAMNLYKAKMSGRIEG